jgi:uncharacterized lipoprotein YajG
MNIMNRAMSIVLAGALVLVVGCANKNTSKQASTDWESTTSTPEMTTSASAATNTSETTTSATAATQPATAESAKWVGAWQLAAPRQNTKAASITADGNIVVIHAGEDLSCPYIVQGQFLLAYTRDERMRTIAWRINSDDSITVERGPNSGSEFNGITMVRAPETSAAQASTDEAITGR